MPWTGCHTVGRYTPAPSRSAQRRRHGNLRRTRPFCSQAATAGFRRRRSSRSRRTTAIWIRGSTACRGMSSRSWSSRAVRPRRMRRLWPARRSGAIGVPASCCRNCRNCRNCRCRRCRRCRCCCCCCRCCRSFPSFPSCRYCLSSLSSRNCRCCPNSRCSCRCFCHCSTYHPTCLRRTCCRSRSCHPTCRYSTCCPTCRRCRCLYRLAPCWCRKVRRPSPGLRRRWCRGRFWRSSPKSAFESLRCHRHT